MTTIENLLGELLLRHNCVIIPSFGGFVAQQAPSKVDYISGSITPPRKSLMFNKQLINNDGLLVNELAQVNNLDYSEALLEVKNKVAAWNKLVSKGERIELEKIGYIYADKNKILCFEQDRFYNLLLSSYGLGKIQFVAEGRLKVDRVIPSISLKEQTVEFEEKITPVFDVLPKENETVKKVETVIVEHPALQNKKTKAWKYIAAACILPIAFYSIWIPMKTDVLESGVIAFSDFNPFKKEQASSYKRLKISEDLSAIGDVQSALEDKIEDLPSDVNVYTYKYDDELFIPVRISEEGNTNNENVIPEVGDNFEVNAMHFIVGCFGEELNANNMVSKLKAEGLDARIVDIKNGLHRVSAGAAISLESYKEVKNKAQGLGYKGWMLK